ncbi:CpaD family pilus assembly protein [Novosphingobium piscinae]|uniref:CpaD family pilus assembly protein n=1 Tax=Novosphingobium piscinae TaxID=1507448 RepID=A0A7X1KRI6_9SPHN|nr:CpaD family pilus assembly protein [Novosphingobium piscinae]MBC2670826.1 CpaD family pilus assembly protein [Novosphingobium piscinae]
MRTPNITPLALALSLALAGCGGMPTNRSLESINQPVVEKTNFVLDLNTGPGGLSLPEQRRLSGWFDTMDLKYGDKIYIDDPLASAGTRAAVEAVAARYGLLLNDGAPVTQGYVNAGTARVVVVRATASVPNCPKWTGDSDANFHNATSPNYGCAVNSNLAAMVADPEHLVKGVKGSGETTIVSATKAIDVFRDRPAKAGEVNQTSSKSN